MRVPYRSTSTHSYSFGQDCCRRPSSRKVWAKLRVEGMRTSQERVRRLMRAHDLQAPHRVGQAHGPTAHDGTITTETPDVMWGTDMTATVTVGGGVAGSWRFRWQDPSTAAAHPAGRSGGASRQRSRPRTTTPSHRHGERGPGCRPANSQRGTSSYTWDEPSTASLQCGSCGDEKGGPNRPTRRRSFMQQRPWSTGRRRAPRVRGVGRRATASRPLAGPKPARTLTNSPRDTSSCTSDGPLISCRDRAPAAVTVAREPTAASSQPKGCAPTPGAPGGC